jgi:hypothetical protein
MTPPTIEVCIGTPKKSSEAVPSIADRLVEYALAEQERVRAKL